MNLIAVNKEGVVYELRDPKVEDKGWVADYRVLRFQGGGTEDCPWINCGGLFPLIDYSFVNIPAH